MTASKHHPTVEALEAKLFAIHATPTFPADGVIHAGAQDIRQRWDGDVPSFRPTLHFSLGELVRPHSDINDWEKEPYAVITPLGKLTKQLLNVFPYDTFILGDLHLDDETIILFPKGTQRPSLSSNIQTIEYNPQKGLRRAVEMVIKQKGGWKVQMYEESGFVGSSARINGTEVATADFFASFLREHPSVSFGSHINSEVGEAFRFGQIDMTIRDTILNYLGRYGPPYSTQVIRFNRAIIDHHLSRLEAMVAKAGFDDAACSVFAEKKERLLRFLNIVDVDLYLREHRKRTLSDARREDLTRRIIDNRSFYEEALKVAEPAAWFPLAKQEPLHQILTAYIIKSMPPSEVNEFIANNPKAFYGANHGQLMAYYAIARWLLTGTENATRERLDQQVSDAATRGFYTAEDIFEVLMPFLDKKNTHLPIALDILRQPAVQAYLTTQGIKFRANSPKTLSDVLRAHPETRGIYEGAQRKLTEQEEEAYEVLTAISETYQTELSDKHPKNFEGAKSAVRHAEIAQIRLIQDLKTVRRPINIVRERSALLVGQRLNLYEGLRQWHDGKAVKIWEPLGLAATYRQEFRTDAEFWQSPMSMLDIFHSLKTRALQEDRSKGSGS